MTWKLWKTWGPWKRWEKLACIIIIAGALIIGAGMVRMGAWIVELKQENFQLKQTQEDTGKKSQALQQEQARLQAIIKRLQSNKVNPGVYQPHLRRIIQASLSWMKVRNIADWERLIMLTIATESDLGRFAKQVRGPAIGITQCEPETERVVLNWLKIKRPELYARIKGLRVPAHIGIHEAEYNTAYSVALCYGVYLMRGVDPHGKSTENLATLYKRHYNTMAGKATVAGVLDKLTMYGIKI